VRKTFQLPLYMKNYIQELLYEHNSVIIPSFGGFTAGYKPASIDHVQGVIFPPSKDLKFNRYLTINDGVLVQHICESKGWTRQEAEQSIKDWVAEMKASLERREMLEFPSVGRLYLDYEGNFQFLQDNTNYNRTSFGLPTVGFYPVTRNRQAVTQDAPQPRESVAVLDLGGTPSRSRIISGWFQRNVPYIVAASFLILAGTFLIIESDKSASQAGRTPFVKKTVTSSRVNKKPQREEDTEIATLYPEDMIDATVVTIEDEAVDEPKKKVYEPSMDEDIDTEGATAAPDQEEGIVIIGSFGSKKNVDRLVKKIYSKGYEPFTEKTGKLTRVGVRFGYGDLGEVKSKRKNVASDFKVKAWVMQPEMTK
jgi:nucleoid DNA-binding protein